VKLAYLSKYENMQQHNLYSCVSYMYISCVLGGCTLKSLLDNTVSTLNIKMSKCIESEIHDYMKTNDSIY